jgi:hypothetical protein
MRGIDASAQPQGIIIDRTSDCDDPDGDGMNNWQELVCYTCPANLLMNLGLVSAVPIGANAAVRCKSAAVVKVKSG